MVIYCNCSYNKEIKDNIKEGVIERLNRVDEEVLAIHDLCKLSAKNSELLNNAVNADRLTIIACYPRAVMNLLKSAGVERDQALINFVNMKEVGEHELDSHLKSLTLTATTRDIEFVDEIEDWVPWFPVIDKNRCDNCKQCASFCLFGTYTTDDKGTVKVENPENCKNNCPACARICPNAAIIFPKCEEHPINGAEITNEEAWAEKIKLNVEQLLGDDVYEALAERRRKAQKIKLRKKAIEQAENERKQHLQFGSLSISKD
ncbi:MAG: ferredoxin family protein [Bacteroidales bacterium]|nr:ferredoxin family protein [Bacteroidales bacterium]